MKNNFLAQSLAKNNAASDEKKQLDQSSSGVGGPKSLRSMANAIENLTSHAPQDLDPAQIADSEIEDRIDTLEGLENLVDSIRASGQKLPILVRHRKAQSGPIYEVVYGRRRLAACRILGIKVKAFVREMDQTEALMSQALENSARMDRSFIEQALFALRLSQAGLSGEQIIEGLAINQTLLKRLMVVSRVLSSEIIVAIGPAHAAGRRPWLELKDLIKANPQITQGEILGMIDAALPSYERLTGLISQLNIREQRDRSAIDAPDVMHATGSSERLHNQLKTTNGQNEIARGQRTVGSLSFTSGHKRAILVAEQKADRGFLDYLGDRLDDLYAEWVNKKT